MALLSSGTSNDYIVSIWDPMYSELHTDLQACVERGCSVRGINIEVKEPLNTLDNHINRIAERDNDQQAASKLIFEILSEMEEDF